MWGSQLWCVGPGSSVGVLTPSLPQPGGLRRWVCAFRCGEKGLRESREGARGKFREEKWRREKEREASGSEEQRDAQRDGKRRVFHEQEERRSEGRFCGLPGSPGTGRLWLQDGAETHRLQRHQHSGSSRCCPRTQGATSSGKHNLHKCAHKCVRSPRRAAHPHPPSSLQACTALAARPAAPARHSLPGSGLLPQPPYAGFARLNALFIGTAGAGGLPKTPVTPSRCSAQLGRAGGVEGCCGVPKLLSFSSSPGGTRPRRLVFLHRGAAVCVRGHPVKAMSHPERCHVLSGAVSRVVPRPEWRQVHPPPSQSCFQQDLGTAMVHAMASQGVSSHALDSQGSQAAVTSSGTVSRTHAEWLGVPGRRRWSRAVGRSWWPGWLLEQRLLLLQPCSPAAARPLLRFAVFLRSALCKSIRCDHRTISSPILAPQPPSAAQGEGEHLNMAAP